MGEVRSHTFSYSTLLHHTTIHFSSVLCFFLSVHLSINRSFPLTAYRMQLFLIASLSEFFLCRIMTGDVCVVCKMTRKLDISASMHRIPVEKSRRARWIRSLRLVEKDIKAPSRVQPSRSFQWTQRYPRSVSSWIKCGCRCHS